jgi:hypothetical protein
VYLLRRSPWKVGNHKKQRQSHGNYVGLLVELPVGTEKLWRQDMAEKSQNIFIKQSAQEIPASYSDTLMKAENTSKLAMMSSGPTRRAMRVRTKSFEFFLLTNRHSVLSTDIREPSHHTKRTIPRWCSYESSIPPSAASAGFCLNTTSRPWDSHQGSSPVFFVLLRKTWP